jgi:phosphoribosylanthranilate isomerase
VEKLPEGVEKVGVFVGESIRSAEKVRSSVGLDALQVYTTSGQRVLEVLKNVGAWPPGKRKSGQTKIYLALSMSEVIAEKVEEKGLTVEMQDPQGEFVALLVDSGSGAQPGGTGVAFDWNQASAMVADLSLRHKVVIAGGLKPQNVGAAIQILRPWGVDVVSGVEARPGKKDPEKVRAFVRAVRESDRKVG